MSSKQKEEKIDDDDGRCSPAHANNDNKTDTTSTNISIRMVIQRYRKASLLIDEKDYVTVGEEEESNEQPNTDDDSDDKEEHTIKSNSNSNNPGHIGMLVYISFSKIATSDVVQRAAKTILNLPIQTEGAWGDGSSTNSILQAAAANANAEASKQQQQQQGKVATTNNNNNNNVSIMLVPQANLIAKVTRNGKSVQYRDQIDKKQGEELYNLFVKYVKEILIENKQIITQQGSKTKTATTNKGTNNNNNNNAMAAADPSILPKELFRHRQEQQLQQNQNQNINTTATNTNTPLLYGSFDENTGLPLTTADGNPLTKSATKRIKKQYDAHTKRHEKYLLKLKQQQPIPIPIPIPTADTTTAAADTTTATTDDDDDDNNSNNQKIELREDKQEEWTNDSPCKNKDKERENYNDDDNEDENLFVQLIAGSFGKRQGLQLVSDMGPFCHVIEL
jgi:hypothetical protein